MTNDTYPQQELSRAVYLGSKSLGLSVFKVLFAASPNFKWTIIHANDTEDERSALSDWQNLARLLDLDLLISSSKAATKEMIRDLKPDIGFVCGWYSLLDKETLSLVPNGLWGIHNSLLPKYRGGSPLVWSIINGDTSVGSTVFKISEGMDNGEVLLQISVCNTHADNIESLLKKIETSLLNALPEKWQLLTTGSASLYKQNESQATYCGQRIESDGCIDWAQNAIDVHNFIRAQSPPYPCAFTYYKESKIKIFLSEVFAGIFYGTPGQVLQRNGDSVMVACGNNSAIIIKKMSVDNVIYHPSDYLKSLTIRLSNYSE